MYYISIAIVTEDMVYGTALAKGLMAFNSHFRATLLRSTEVREKNCLKEYLLVIWDLEEDLDTADPRYIKLSDYKYGNVNEFGCMLLFQYGQISGNRIFSLPKEKSKILCFCSVEGGVGTTTITKAVAQEFARFHSKKILCLSFDEFEDTLQYVMQNDKKKTVGEYLYFLTKGSNLTSVIDCFVLSDEYGVEAFKPQQGRNELKELDESALYLLLESLTSSNRYDYIFVDLGKNTNVCALRLMELCRRIVLVTQETASDYKLKRMLDYLFFQLDDEVKEKIHKVINKYTYTSEINTEFITLDFDPESFYFEDGLKKISIEKDFGLGIKHLVNALL